MKSVLARVTGPLARVAGVAALMIVCSAHVGSPDAWYQGNAGPYPVVIQVATPGVVPGVARVFVRVTGDGIKQVTAQANRFDALAAAPPPEIAEPVEGDAGLYMAPLWIMSGGSNSVTVNVTGALGAGTAVVPVVVVADRRLEMDNRLGTALAAVGLFLFVGLVTIIGAAVREGVLQPGEQPDDHRRWKARTSMGVTAAVLALALFGGSRWWKSEDTSFTRSMYKPLASSATIESNGGTKVLNLRISDSIWIMRHDTAWIRKQRASKWTPLIADHGKIIHAFMVREPDLRAFAHLHPTSVDSVSFTAVLPPLPAGRYRVYGDIVHESGFTQTLSSKVELPEPTTAAARLTDPDDASHTVTVAPNADRAVLADGTVMTFARGGVALIEGRNAELRVSIVGTDGKPLTLEPYIGMAGHAVVARDDGAVFVHLHPSGTISMASQMAITMRQPDDSVAGRLGQRINAMKSSHQPAAVIPTDGVITFPYAFPKPGKYHLWVQVKSAGRILTGAFAVEVQPARA